MTRTSQPWQRVNRQRPCPICNKRDWCLYSGDAGDPTAVICARTESQKQAGEAGWLHVLRDDGPTWPVWRRTIRTAVKMMDAAKPVGIGFDRIATDCRQAAKPEALGRLADGLGVTAASLRRLRVGWSKQHGAWTFPMVGADGRVVGIRLRLTNGRKLAVRGGREGLFVPEGLTGDGPLLIAEGPTDTAALLDLGFDVIGRPSCTGGQRLLVDFVQRRQPPEVVVVADGDGPGKRGAESLAVVLVAYAAAVRVITPPEGVKDAREWKRRGATRQEVQEVIDAAKVCRLSVQIRRKAGRRNYER